MKDDILQVLLTEERLRERVAALGRKISADYKDKDLLLVGVLKGSVVFMADLMRAIDIPCGIDFLCVSSYGNGTQTTGRVKIVKNLQADLRGKDLLLVEDILDTGVTLSTVRQLLLQQGAASVKICTLLDKPARRKADIQADYCGFTVPDAFVVGYGLDYAEKYRNLSFVGILKPEVYNK